MKMWGVMVVGMMVAGVVVAGDATAPTCPPPKKLTCKQLLELAPQRCAQGEINAIASKVPCPPQVKCPKCPTVVTHTDCPEVKCSGASGADVERMMQYCRSNPVVANVYVPRDHGVPLVHVGAGYLDGPTGSVGAGWRFINGMDLLANVVYQYQDSHQVDAYALTGYEGRWPQYTPTTYNDESQHHWGVTIGLTIPLDKYYTHKK